MLIKITIVGVAAALVYSYVDVAWHVRLGEFASYCVIYSMLPGCLAIGV